MTAIVPQGGAVIGEVTGARYPFHQSATLLVDSRDAVFMLGEEIDLAT